MSPVRSVTWDAVLPPARPAPKQGKPRLPPEERRAFLARLAELARAELRKGPRTFRQLLRATGAYETDLRAALHSLPAHSVGKGRKTFWRLA